MFWMWIMDGDDDDVQCETMFKFKLLRRSFQQQEIK